MSKNKFLLLWRHFTSSSVLVFCSCPLPLETPLVLTGSSYWLGRGVGKGWLDSLCISCLQSILLFPQFSLLFKGGHCSFIYSLLKLILKPNLNFSFVMDWLALLPMLGSSQCMYPDQCTAVKLNESAIQCMVWRTLKESLRNCTVVITILHVRGRVITHNKICRANRKVEKHFTLWSSVGGRGCKTGQPSKLFPTREFH